MNVLPAFALGLLSGLRSITTLAFFSDYISKRKSRATLPLSLLTLPQTALVLKLMAAGEITADKTPFIPARTQLIPLVGRAVCGGLIGAALSEDDPLEGGTVGVVGAIIGTYIAYYTRRNLGQNYHIPDVLLAVAEDAIVLSATKAVIRNNVDQKA